LTKQVLNVTNPAADTSPTTANAAPGNTLEYDFFYNNSATTTATGVTVTDVLIPTGQTFAGCVTSCSVSGNTVSFTNITIPGSFTSTSVNQAFRVTVNAGFTGTIPNSGTISQGVNSNPSNSTAVTVSPATTTTTLAASKTVQNLTTGLPTPPASTANASSGNTLRFFLNFANTGINSANVTLTDPLPAGTIFLACAPSPCFAASGTVTFGPYVTAAGTGGQATVDLQISNTFNGSLSNTFTAGAANAVAVTSAAATVTVSGSAGATGTLTVEKQVANVSRGGAESTGVSAFPGDHIRYFIQVNAVVGQLAGNNVVVTDTLQPAQTFTNNCSVPCTFDGVNTVRLTVGTVNTGTPVTVSFDATVNAAITGTIIQNTATAAGTNTGTATSNTTSVVIGQSVVSPVTCPSSCYFIPPYYPGNGTCVFQAYGCVGNAFANTITICGVVQSFQAATIGASGFITINNEAFILMPSLIVSGTVTIGISYCFTLTLNAFTQITSMTVSPNVAGANYVCGMVTPFANGYSPYTGYAPYAGYTPYPGYSPFFANGPNTPYGPYQMNGSYYGWNGPMVIGGYPYQVSPGFAFPFSPAYGNPYCFIVNQAGAVNGSLSVVPTAATAIETPSGTRRAHGSGSV